MKRQISFFLAALLAVTALASCGDNANGNETTTTEDTQTTAPAEPEYEFRRNWDGDTVSFLNYEDLPGMNASITTEAENGDVLNDAKYKCMVTLEDRMGVTMVETRIDRSEYLSFARNTLAAAEDTYDFLYVNESARAPLIQDGYLLNLLELDDLSLDEDWWLHELNDLTKAGGKLYCAEGYSNLLVADSINIMLFNEDIASKLNLDAPYSIVKEGKWTLEKFGEYLKAGESLNLGADVPDDSNVWNYDQPGNGAGCSGLLVGAGENFFEVNDGKLVLTAGSERFYNACDKIASMMSQNQPYMYFKKMYGVAEAFKTNQAMFAYGEIASTQQLREQDFTFGVLPNPKLDDDQDRYYCRKSWPSAGVSIPKTAKDSEKSAAFADALNYLSREIVWTAYREIVLEQKSLRNDESIEMLDIILRSSVPSLNSIYNVGGNLINSIGEKLLAGDNDIASLVASDKSSIESVLDEVNSRE